jgi:hypothetical protein
MTKAKEVDDDGTDPDHDKITEETMMMVEVVQQETIQQETLRPSINNEERFEDILQYVVVACVTSIDDSLSRRPRQRPKSSTHLRGLRSWKLDSFWDFLRPGWIHSTEGCKVITRHIMALLYFSMNGGF